MEYYKSYREKGGAPFGKETGIYLLSAHRNAAEQGINLLLLLAMHMHNYTETRAIGHQGERVREGGDAKGQRTRIPICLLQEVL